MERGRRRIRQSRAPVTSQWDQWSRSLVLEPSRRLSCLREVFCLTLPSLRISTCVTVSQCHVFRSPSCGMRLTHKTCGKSTRLAVHKVFSACNLYTGCVKATWSLRKGGFAKACKVQRLFIHQHTLGNMCHTHYRRK